MVTGRWAKPVIVGQLVTLGPFVPEHIDAIWEMVNDPEGNDLTATDEVFTFEQIEQWYRTRNDADGRLDLAITENATGEWAGEVVLNEYEPEAARASFRISLRGPAWFGRGLGTEATDLIVGHGFEQVGLRQIVLEVLARNPRARRAYEKAGFVVTDTSMEDGEDWVHMAIDRPGPPGSGTADAG
jgi:RimJ/RimL family protein N-acetyltransferase